MGGYIVTKRMVDEAVADHQASSRDIADGLIAMPYRERLAAWTAPVRARVLPEDHIRVVKSLLSDSFEAGRRSAHTGAAGAAARTFSSAIGGVARAVSLATREEPVFGTAARWLGVARPRMSRWTAVAMPHAIRAVIWSSPLWASRLAEQALIYWTGPPRGFDLARWAWTSQAIAAGMVWFALVWMAENGWRSARLPAVLCLVMMALPLAQTMPSEVQRLVPMARAHGIQAMALQADACVWFAVGLLLACLWGTYAACRRWLRADAAGVAVGQAGDGA